LEVQGDGFVFEDEVRAKGWDDFPFLLVCAVLEGFWGKVSEIQGAFGEFEPIGCPFLGIGQFELLGGEFALKL